MKRSFLIAVIICGAVSISSGQEIKVEKVFGGYKYTKGAEILTMKKLSTTLESQPEAFELIKKAKTNNALATVLGFAGGALIGYPVGTALGGGEPNWAMAGVGAGLLVVGIPIASSANKQTKEAVEMYNASLASRYRFDKKPQFYVSTNVSGLSIKMVF